MDQTDIFGFLDARPKGDDSPEVALPPRDEHDLLAQRLREADHAYHVLGEPELSDAEYDALRQRLVSLETEYPGLRTPDSPSESVGHSVAGTPFEKVRHRTPMLSLANAFSPEETREWERREVHPLGRSSLGPLFVECKIDGLSLELTYEGGRLVSAATRGDGTIGDLVTSNARAIDTIPERLRGEYPRHLSVRGEVYLPRTRFALLNEERSRDGLPLFSTARNAAAGGMRTLDPAVTASRGLAFFAYQIVLEGDSVHTRTQADMYRSLAAWGFPVCPAHAVRDTLEEAEAFAAEIYTARETFDYEIDGMVLKVNDVILQGRMGNVGRTPRWAIARKWPAEAVVTRLLDVTWQVGRTGKVTPVAIVDATEIGGVLIRNATLHNHDHARSLDLRIGDRVRLIRSGEVIPRILGVAVGADGKPARDGREREIEPPTLCPSCRESLRRGETDQGPSADYFCHNWSCPAQTSRRIVHFAARAAMDIRGLGEEAVEKLVSHRLVLTPADLYSLEEHQIRTLPGFAAASALNLVNAIQASRDRPFHNLLWALGIPHVGERAAELLVDRFGDWRSIEAAGEEEISSIPGIGPVLARSVLRFTRDPRNREMMSALAAHGLPLKRVDEVGIVRGALTGKTVVITGTLTIPRAEVAARLKGAGARVASSVSASTHFLVCGEKSGSKRERAVQLGVRILEEEDLNRLLSPSLGDPE